MASRPDDASRDPDGVLGRVPTPDFTWPRGWIELLGANLSNARDAAAILARLGGHPIAIHGVKRDGSCTCGRADCAAIGKHPVEPNWQRAPLDMQHLDDLLRERWGLNLGWRMGKQPNGWTLIAIDVDGPRSLLEPLEAKLGRLPPTLRAATPRGMHLIYRIADGKPVPKNRVRLAPGVDIRSEGGQIVVSPSWHACGVRYHWVEAREPEVLP